MSQVKCAYEARWGIRCAPLLVAPAFLLVLTLVLAGCSSGYQKTSGQGQAVHTFRIGYNNSHALIAGDGAIVVDAGLEGDAPELLKQLEDAGIKPRSISAIIVTHGHTDHAGGAAFLRKSTGAAVFAGEGDRAMLASGANDKLCPTDDRGRKDLSKHQASRYRGFEADVWISSETSLAPSTGIDAHLVQVPGHTGGSLVVIAKEWAFVGDMFRGSIVGTDAETHFYMCDLKDNAADIEWLLAEYPGVKTFFTGHFGPVSRASVVKLLQRSAVP